MHDLTPLKRPQNKKMAGRHIACLLLTACLSLLSVSGNAHVRHIIIKNRTYVDAMIRFNCPRSVQQDMQKKSPLPAGHIFSDVFLSELEATCKVSIDMNTEKTVTLHMGFDVDNEYYYCGPTDPFNVDCEAYKHTLVFYIDQQGTSQIGKEEKTGD